MGEHGGVEWPCLANKTGAVEGQGHVVRLGQLVLVEQTLVQTLTDTAVGAISTDQDVGVVACVVRAPYHHTLTVLEQREDLLAHADLVCRYETAQDVV